MREKNRQKTKTKLKKCHACFIIKMPIINNFWYFENCVRRKYNLNKITTLTCTWKGFGNIYYHQIFFLLNPKGIWESGKMNSNGVEIPTNGLLYILSNSISPFKSNNRYHIDLVAFRVTTKLIHNFWYINMQSLSDRPSVLLRMYLDMQ